MDQLSALITARNAQGNSGGKNETHQYSLTAIEPHLKGKQMILLLLLALIPFALVLARLICRAFSI